MNITLSDLGNYAQILSLPLSVLLWRVTAERFGRFWKRWKRIVFLILSSVALGAAWRLGWIGWATQLVHIPVWGVCLLGISGFFLSWLIWKTVRWMANASANQKRESGIVEDVEWHWRLVGDRIDGNSLTALCPDASCRHRLDSEDVGHIGDQYGYQLVDHIRLVCPRCGFRRDYNCNQRELVRRVGLEIERRFQTGEYP